MSQISQIHSGNRVKAIEGLRHAGISVDQWAKANGYTTATVKSVLYGSSKGLRGEAHRVAIALGIKSGVAVNPKGFVPVPRKHVPMKVVRT